MKFWLTVNQDVDLVSAKRQMEGQLSIDQVSIECWSSVDREYWSSVHQVIMCWSGVLIKGIHQHSTVDALSIHDPMYLIYFSMRDTISASVNVGEENCFCNGGETQLKLPSPEDTFTTLMNKKHTIYCRSNNHTLTYYFICLGILVNKLLHYYFIYIVRWTWQE